MTANTTPAAPEPEVKKNLAIIALILTIVSSILMIFGHWYSAKKALDSLGSLDLASAESAETLLLVFVGIASVVNLAAFVISIVAVVKSNPKVFPVIVLVVVIVLPVIALFIGRGIQTGMGQALLNSL